MTRSVQNECHYALRADGDGVVASVDHTSDQLSRFARLLFFIVRDGRLALVGQSKKTVVVRENAAAPQDLNAAQKVLQCTGDKGGACRLCLEDACPAEH